MGWGGGAPVLDVNGDVLRYGVCCHIQQGEATGSAGPAIVHPTGTPTKRIQPDG